jgi:hypothetical protein
MTTVFPGLEGIPPWTSAFARLARYSQTLRNHSHLRMVYGIDDVGQRTRPR